MTETGRRDTPDTRSHFLTSDPVSNASTSYDRAFVAWFAERANEEFPIALLPGTFTQHYLSEVGYAKLFKELKADPSGRDPRRLVFAMTNKTLLVPRYFAYRFCLGGSPASAKEILVLAYSRNYTFGCWLNDIRLPGCGKPIRASGFTWYRTERK